MHLQVGMIPRTLPLCSVWDSEIEAAHNPDQFWIKFWDLTETHKQTLQVIKDLWCFLAKIVRLEKDANTGKL